MSHWFVIFIHFLQSKCQLLFFFPLQVELNVLQPAETASVQSGERCEQVLAVVVFINRPVHVNDH